MFENEVLETEVPSTSEVERQWDDIGGRPVNAEPFAGSELPEKRVLSEAQVPGVNRKKRVKRTEAEMIKALGGSALKEATYVSDRVSKIEDKISELMGAISPAARELILKDNPHLNRY